MQGIVQSICMHWVVDLSSMGRLVQARGGLQRGYIGVACLSIVNLAIDAPGTTECGTQWPSNKHGFQVSIYAAVVCIFDMADTWFNAFSCMLLLFLSIIPFKHLFVRRAFAVECAGASSQFTAKLAHRKKALMEPLAPSNSTELVALHT